MQNRFLRSLLLLTSVGLFAASCEAPTDLPVDSGRSSFGAVADPNLGHYFYPHRAGVTYVYSNKLTTFTPNGPSTVTGNNDTVRTLGFQGMDQDDSVFAISITYQVAAGMDGRGISPLRYLPTSASFGGAYINGNAPIQGEATTYSLATRSTSTDSITAPTFGRMRALASDLAGSGTTIWQTDTIYYTSSTSHVTLLAKTATGSFIPTKDIFRSDVSVVAGNEWSYSRWQTRTKFKIVSESELLTVGSTTMNTIHAKIENADLNAGSLSEKFYAPYYGPVKQVETFWTTSDGATRTKQTLTREGVVVLDLDEIAGM